MNIIPCSDEEEDVESLRLAALQTMKKNSVMDVPSGPYHGNFKQGKGNRGKWGRFGHQGRVAKNAQFQNRIRTTNLISLTPASDETDNPNGEIKEKSEEIKDVTNVESTSKFNRYDKSDNESEDTEMDDGILGELNRSNSLEALMQELDEEIQGKPNAENDGIIIVKKAKPKKNRRKRRNDNFILDPQGNVDVLEMQSQPVLEDIVNSNNEILPMNHPEHIFAPTNIPGTSFRKRPGSRSPFRRNPFHKRHNPHFQNMMPQPHFPFPEHFPPQMPPFIHPQPNPMFMQPGFNMPPRFPPFFERPISPLAINTESLTTATMAPLSPRSAAFVMQNKAIIEKRKRSPRRSYSRSPSRSLSRSPRRSLSPLRRSFTPPRRFRRSVSPRRSPPRSPRRFSPRKRSLSPRKRSLSPRRRSVSPKRKPPVANPGKNRPPVHNRLGVKSDLPEEDQEKEKEKEKPKEKEIKEVPEEPLDPVLAARKKKFESNEIKKKEGIIRLKPKDDKPESSNEPSTLTDPKPIESKPIVVSKPAETQTETPVITKSVETKPLPPPRIISKPITISKPVETKPQTISKPSKISKPIQSKPKPPVSVKPVTIKPATSTVSKPVVNKVTAVKPKPVDNKTTPASATSSKPVVVKTEDKPKPSTTVEKKKEQTIDQDPDEFKELERLLNDDAALEDFLLDHKVGDIFSDEESASDNEGRFKVKEKNTEVEKPPVLSFGKLVNGSKQEIKAEPLPDSSKNSTFGRDRNRQRIQPPSYSKEKEPEIKKEKITMKPPEISQPGQSTRQPTTIERRPARPIERRQDRKIEIKIKNPAKYEKTGKTKTVIKPEPEKTQSKIVVPIRDEFSSEDSDDDVIIEETNDSEDDENVLTEGDLRTQLSRKRAEKRYRHPAEEVSTRILQYALEGALFKKAKKKSKRKTLTLSDSKLPIQFRLGITNPEDIFEEIKIKKKKKRKNREQV